MLLLPDEVTAARLGRWDVSQKMAGDRVTCKAQQRMKERCGRDGYLGSIHQNVKKTYAGDLEQGGQTAEKIFLPLIRRSPDTNSMIALDGFRQLRIE